MCLTEVLLNFIFIRKPVFCKAKIWTETQKKGCATKSFVKLKNLIGTKISQEKQLSFSLFLYDYNNIKINFYQFWMLIKTLRKFCATWSWAFELYNEMELCWCRTAHTFCVIKLLIFIYKSWPYVNLIQPFEELFASSRSFLIKIVFKFLVFQILFYEFIQLKIIVASFKNQTILSWKKYFKRCSHTQCQTQGNFFISV